MLFAKSARAAVAALVLSLAPALASAQFTGYTDLGAFLGAVGNNGTDTYAGFDISQQTFGPLNRSAGAYGYTVSTTNTSFFGAGTVGDPWLSTNTATDMVTFNNFGGGIFGIGGNFFTSNISGNWVSGDITLEAQDINGLTSSVTLFSTTTSTFYAFSSTFAIVSLKVSSVQPIGGGFLWPTIDNLVLAEAGDNQEVVPEPATMTLLATGLAGLVGAKRRRRLN
jgi:PEP-CTERM motif